MEARRNESEEEIQEMNEKNPPIGEVIMRQWVRAQHLKALTKIFALIEADGGYEEAIRKAMTETRHRIKGRPK